MKITCKLCAYRKRVFLDAARIYVQGGAGGMGMPKYGGIGGPGGNIILQCHESKHLTVNETIFYLCNKENTALTTYF